MGIYYCHGCQTQKDDDHHPMCESEMCEECDQVLEGWTITLNPKPIPLTDFDWDYVHEDFDGENGLCGSARSYKAAVKEIIEIEED